MSVQNHDDLIPRPLPIPKPQVEIVSVQPEVPEPSLIFDKFVPPQTKFVSFKLNSDSHKPPINSNFSDSNYRSNQKFNNVNPQWRYHEIPTATTSYSSSTHSNQTDSNLISRKVSFSPLSNESELSNSRDTVLKVSDHVKYPRNSESHSCKCNNHDLEADAGRNNYKCDSSQPYPDLTRKLHRVSFDCDRIIQDEICSKTRCFCASCTKEHFDSGCNYASEEPKPNLVSAEELQKMVLKFENLFLKLNYKYSKITENFVSKDEFNAVIRSYEARIHSMQKMIDTVVANNRNYRCNYCNQIGQTFEARERSQNLVFPKSNTCVSLEKSEPLKNSHNNNCNFIHEHALPSNNCVSNVANKYEIEPNDRRPHFQYEPFQCQAVPSENQRTNSLSSKDELRNSHRDIVHRDVVTVHEVSSKNKPNHIRNHQENQNVITKEIESTNNDRCQEYEQETLPNFKDDTQLKLICSNIIMQVKEMLEKNQSTNTDGIADPVKVIKQATIEQFDKIGLNVNNVIEEDKQSSRENEDPNVVFLPAKNTGPSDLSLCMNSLAMKYISNYQKDENDSGEKKSTINDVSVNCNNVSIATLRYLERHQILSELDKPLNFNTHDHMSSARMFKMSEPNPNNDRSFIR